ncbi:MAG: hypothetical protein IKM94_02190 [Alphaproteobacteria bacterium]|nr:hypothetical protein [Alphaproteobacteria bacterium]
MPYVIAGDGKKHLSTWMHEYSVHGCNCPECMTVENCPLRKELADLETKYRIGYRVLEDGTLSFPSFAYHEREDKSINVAQIQRDICDKCFTDNRQNVKG